MTFEEKLGFAVAKELLDQHNEELQKAKNEFFDEFQKVWDKGLEKGIKMFDLERAMVDFIETIKIEYYKAGKQIDDVVQSETLKKQISNATA